MLFTVVQLMTTLEQNYPWTKLSGISKILNDKYNYKLFSQIEHCLMLTGRLVVRKCHIHTPGDIHAKHSGMELSILPTKK